VKRVHNCLLSARIPNLYKELRDSFRCKRTPYAELSETSGNVLYIRITPLAIESNSLVTFLRKVYSDNDIRKDEVELLRKIRTWIANNPNFVNSPNNNQTVDEVTMMPSPVQACNNVDNSEINDQQKKTACHAGNGTFSDVSEIEDVNVSTTFRYLHFCMERTIHSLI